MQILSSQELARQTLIQLTNSKTPPTPENYHRVYNQIAGKAESTQDFWFVKSFEKVLALVSKEKPKLKNASETLSNSIKKNDYAGFEINLTELLETLENEPHDINLQQSIRFLVNQIDINPQNSRGIKHREEINKFLSQEFFGQNNFIKKFQSLLASWTELNPNLSLSTKDQHQIKELPFRNQDFDNDEKNLKISDSNVLFINAWRDMLIRTIKFVAIPQINPNPSAIHRIEELTNQAKEAKTLDEISAFNESLKKLLLRTEIQFDTQQRLNISLYRVIQLFVLNIREFTTSEDWLNQQLAIIEEITSKPLELETVTNAEIVLNDLASKHNIIKPSLIVAKDTLKNMMSAFVEGLEEITHSTGVYESKINHYKNLIAETEDFVNLDEILQSLASDISLMSAKASESYKAFIETQSKVYEAEQKINELTVKLELISQSAYQDFLTGALNRRGLDEAIEREFNRADKHNTSISISMVDIDHFKKLNDNFGHIAGDNALTHLAKIVKDVLRSTDVLARFGGEEFLILLPGSKQDEAVNLISAVQRSLTKNFFLYEKEKVLITFSAGVAERILSEKFESVLSRADAALYIAKKTGRNKVVGAKINPI